VTGASGFFGSWLVETFHHANKALGLGAELVGVAAPGEDLTVKCPHLLDLEGVRLLCADIRHLREVLCTELPDWCGRTDAIIHAAIHVDGATYDAAPLPTLDTAVNGTWQVLEFARLAGVRRFLFVSSGAIYGTQSAAVERIAENDPVLLDPANPRSAYGEGKRIGETLCASYFRQFGVPAVIARPFAFVGPHLPIDRHFAIGNFIRDALAGGPVVVQSDGSALRSYLYASDLAAWLWTILATGTPGRPYNVGSEHAISLRNLAASVAKAIGPGICVEIRGASVPGPPHRYIPSTARARGELHLNQTVTLADAIERTLAWHRSAQ
jgi:dTDP-glucose 4,6-dehydratase